MTTVVLYKEKPTPIKPEELDELKENADRLAQMFLDTARKPIHGRPTFVCPFCGRGGAGSKRKDGLQIDKGGMYYCYNCGGKGADIINLYQRVQGVSFREAVRELQRMAGTGECENKPRFSFEAKPKPKVDYMAYIERCRQNITATDYHRGITLDTLRRYWVGFDSSWINPEVVATQKAKGSTWRPPATPRIIIPTSNYGYFARRTGNVDEYDKMYVGEGVPFNIKALKNHNGKRIFVVEGEIDALSFCDVGAMAIGLGGSRGGDDLLKAENLKNFTGKLFFVGDTDGKQDKAYTALCEQVQALGVACEFINGRELFGTSKDANEALNADREEFKRKTEGVLKND